MCNKCSIKFQISDDVHNTITIEGAKSGIAKWEKQKLLWDIPEKYLTTPKDFHLWAFGKGNSDENKDFRAFDEVRRCHKNEIRVINMIVKELKNLTNIKCQSLKENISLKTKTEEIEYFCEDIEKFGPSCNVSCLQVFGQKYCKKVLICQSGKCLCSPGSEGDTCTEGCLRSRYGFNCCASCGHCKEICDTIDGTCPGGCDRDYHGDKCDRTYLYMLLEAPRVKEKGYTDVTFEIINTSYTNLENAMRPDRIAIEYKFPNQEWKTGGNTSFSEGSTMKIENLKPGKTYLYRGVLYSSNKIYLADEIPTNIFTTRCKGLDRNYNITSTETSCEISLGDKAIACPDISYTLKNLSGTNKNMRHHIESAVDVFYTIETLKPFTTYKFYYNSINIVNCTTKEDAPVSVELISIFNITKNSAIITWNEPTTKNGIIRNYEMSYKVVNYKHCYKYSTDEPKINNVTETIFFIENLRPYTKYIARVRARTVKWGEYNEVNFDTLEDETLNQEEIPTELRFSEYSDHLNLEWTEECQNMTGKINYTFYAICQNIWCENSNDYYRNYSSESLRKGNGKSSKILTQLIPYTSYNVTIMAIRKQSALLIANKIIRTKAAAPPKVKNLEVYAKNRTNISFRWNKPFPPYGQLQDYQFEFDYRGSPVIIPANISCYLYEDYNHCITFEIYKSFAHVNARMWARNKGIIERSEVARIQSIKMEEEASSEPRNLTYTWKNNALTLSWKHPLYPNGYITYFQIQMKPEIFFQYQVKFEERNTYIYSVNLTKLKHSSTYTCTVRAQNSRSYGRESGTINLDIPPKKPELNGIFRIKENGILNITFATIIPPIKPETKSEQSYQYLVVFQGEKVTSYLDEKNHCGLLDSKVVGTNENIWVAAQSNINNEATVFTIGEEKNTTSNDNFKGPQKPINNKKLKPGTNYEAALVLVNQYKTMTECQIYKLNVTTPMENPKESTFNGLWFLLLFLLLPIIFYFLYTKRFKSNLQRSQTVTSILGDQKKAAFFIVDQSYQNDQISMDKVERKPSEKEPKIAILPTVEAKKQKPVNVENIPKLKQEKSKKSEEDNKHLLPEIQKLVLVENKTVTKRQTIAKEIISEVKTKHEVKEQKPHEESNDKTMYSKKIPLHQFERYVRESIENGDLSAQHAMIKLELNWKKMKGTHFQII